MLPIFRANKTSQTGFTLVEILVIAPVVILVLAGLVATIVFSTGSAMRSSARSQLQYEVLAALDRIEADVKLSKSLTIHNGGLHLATFATDRNPFDAERKLIRKDTCQPADTRITIDEVATYWNVYWVNSGKFGRYAKYGTGDSTQHSNMRHCENNNHAIFQRPLTQEALIGGDGTTANVRFTNSSGGIDVELTATKKVAGEDVSFTGRLFVKSLNTP
ncbi:MAG: hypothetical protein Q4A37_00745 [Candidatus Saccharibacteria bacterium]|nr:hypothetical protein [Candidatus Saccharibacteria bacterium]